MVRSMRYWCMALHVLEESDRTLTATSFGQHVLGDQGYDPCLEDPASLWLLYGSLLKPPCLATAWDIAFNQFPRLEFPSDELDFIGNRREVAASQLYL
ncbi:DUF4007 family protein [Leptolyngbya sp. CCY15150]|uniref:DUF4007 family protein n=1 Tax=Leptolyngbya sp. CCY15150 TaxID=2767772 RepID=UPI001EF17E8A|nr:DUF4007 family protein [Leptolyngbya sp. CCY15150]